jgi:hypothetical protein
MRVARTTALAALILLAAVATFDAAQAQTYRILYEHYVFATGGDPPVQDTGLLNNQPTLYGQYSHIGEAAADNYAEARYFVDLHRRAMGSYAYCRGSVENFWPYGFTATGRVERIAFDLDFTFTVPAGTYATGVDVSIEGSVGGTLWANYAASSQVQYTVLWGTDLLSPGLIKIENDATATITIRDPFTLTHQIVAPGTVLGSPQQYTVGLSAGIYDNMTASVREGTSPNYVTGSAGVNMYTGIRFGDVIAPPGVTWETPDSLFMDPPTGAGDVPVAQEPARLERVYPNPFNPATTVSFYLPEAAKVTLAVYDVGGRRVATLADGRIEAGMHESVWQGRDSAGRSVPSGVYFCRLESSGVVDTRKMVLLK